MEFEIKCPNLPFVDLLLFEFLNVNSTMALETMSIGLTLYLLVGLKYKKVNSIEASVYIC